MNKETAAAYWELLNDIEQLVDPGIVREKLPEFRKPIEESSEADSLGKIVSQVTGCTKCLLHETRTNAVPGIGSLRPDVMCIGEAPGADEDQSGEPFVGRAGRYLDKWLEAIDLSRNTNTYIANIVKCRPPGNRDPLPEETASCINYLYRQIELLNPGVILCLGRVAAHNLLDLTESLGRMRNMKHAYKDIPVVVTYHPSAVLRNQELRRPVWQDLRKVKDLLEGRD